MKNLAVFASGEGTNCENLIKYFSNSTNDISVKIVITNNPFAGVIEKTHLLDKECYINLFQSDEDIEILLDVLAKSEISYIVLAGFIKLVPQKIIDIYKDRIINIHPALLPKYGGKGMYGMNIHKAVIIDKENESGISIHLVNEKYDEGKIIAQHKCSVLNDDTPESLALKIHKLEYAHFPKIVEDYILSQH